MDDFKSLEEGQEVEFEVVNGAKGYCRQLMLLDYNPESFSVPFLSYKFVQIFI